MKTAIAALALTALLTACGSDTGDDDNGVTGQETDTPTPTEPPTGPPWPEFTAEDYTFVYSRMCYCPDGGTKIKVTVVDGKATDASYAQNIGDIHKGDPAKAEYQLITIPEIIDYANDTEAFDVQVTWPAGQDYPSSVAVDQIENAVDDEVSFIIHAVQVGHADVDY